MPTKSKKSPAKSPASFGIGRHVAGNYRSGHFTGTVTGVYKQGKTRATTGFAIKPDKASRHPGEPARIHRLGKNLRSK